MIKCLLIGDSHIPRRAKEVPEEILAKIADISKENRIDYVFFTGDLIKAPDLIDFLKNNSTKDVFIVIGNMDYYGGNKDAPDFRDLEIYFSERNKIKIGLTHGAQISPRGDHDQLELLAKQVNCQVFISGHTHHEEVFLTKNGILLLNPGSVTGAWSFVASGIPTFIILDVYPEENLLKVTLYQLNKKARRFNTRDYYFILRNGRLEPK